MNLTLWITAIATGVIATFAGTSFWLAFAIKSRDEEYREQISDLYQAIVISNVVSGEKPRVLQAIRRFKALYKGKTPIYFIEETIQQEGE